MSKISIYIAAGTAIVVLALIITVVILVKRLDIVTRDRDRVQENYAQLGNMTLQHLSLIVTLKELLAIDTLKIDSLSKALKIRPKTITNYVEVIKTVRDTISKEIPVYMKDGVWWASDTGKCWRWDGIAKVRNDSLELIRTNFQYQDSIKSFFFWERKNKFLFIRYGPKIYYQKTSSSCGTEKISLFTIYRKK